MYRVTVASCSVCLRGAKEDLALREWKTRTFLYHFTRYCSRAFLSLCGLVSRVITPLPPAFLLDKLKIRGEESPSWYSSCCRGADVCEGIGLCDSNLNVIDVFRVSFMFIYNLLVLTERLPTCIDGALNPGVSAQERIWTVTPFKALLPQSSVSTKFHHLGWNGPYHSLNTRL